MASPLQQQSVQRKLIYIGLILALFTGAAVFRRVGVEAQAREMSLREEDRSDVELTGAAMRLTLTGSRGIATCILWAYAIDKQKKHQWNELELYVRAVTKLQPHFTTPWLFQSWNLAYNVSVESDRERDQYFYIARGIELLYEGERQNRNHPDMRFAMGHYTMNKIAQGDKKNVLMSLFQMSCIDPKDRDPDRFRSKEGGRTTLKMDEIEKFCSENPQLVRRLRRKRSPQEPPICATPEQLVRFLDENKKLPSLYQEPQPEQDRTPLKNDPGQRFPLLPPPPPRDNLYDPEALHYKTNVSDYVEYIDAYLVSHAWFSYAQESLPNPDPALPGKSQDISDRTKQRTPKMTTLLFRIFPPRAMSYTAERLENEGWFDIQGWYIDDPDARGSQRWFPNRELAPVGTRYNWGVHFWNRAHLLWQRHGTANLLLVPPLQRVDLERRAKGFRDSMGIAPDDRARQFRETDLPPNLVAGFRAHVFLNELEYYVKLSNFLHFYHTSLVESKAETVAARKLFFDAERLRIQHLREQALEKYEEALPAWKQLLEDHEDFQKDDQIQEETYEFQLNYLDLFKSVRSRTIKEELAVRNCVGFVVASPGLQNSLLLALALELTYKPHLLPDLSLNGPFDTKTKRGDPFVKDNVKNTVKGRAPGLRLAHRR